MKIFFPLLLCLFSLGLVAQTNGNNITTYSANTSFKNVDLITGSPLFGLDADHKLRKHYEQSSERDRLHVKYHQYYKELRIMNGTVVFHLQGGNLYATTGRLSSLEGLDVSPHISIRQGERLARLRAGAELIPGNDGSFISPGQLKMSGTELVIANQHFPERGGEHFPAYVYNFIADVGEGFPVDIDIIVNARNGRIINAISNIHAEAITGTGNGFYHDDIVFPVDSLAPNHYELYDESRGDGIFAFDISNFLGKPTDEDNDWSSEREGQAAMLDGYHASVKFYDFLQTRFNRHSIDDQGHALVANMNRHSLVNAYWNGSEATFGNGDCDRYSPLTTFEIVGHEYAHGLTDFTSDLIYQNESGALNESISDIMGKGFEWYYDNDHFNWKIGATIRRNVNERYFRSMNNPSQRNHPKFYKGENWRTGSADAGGVHSNSGVFNFWFYLLVEGKRSGNEAGVQYDVKPIGMDSALQLVYLLESAYLTESSGYEDCYAYSLLAAGDLFGEGSPPYLAVLEAWKAVGLPYVPDAEEPVSIAVETRYLSNGTFDTELCPDELTDMRGIYRNESDSIIPANTTVSGHVIYFYTLDGVETRDTVIIDEQMIDEAIEPGDQFTLQLSYVLTNTPRIVNTTNELTLHYPTGQVYSAEDNDFIFINGVSVAEIEFNFNEVSELCSTPELTDEYITIALPRCDGPTNGTIRFTYSNATDALNYDFELEEFEEPARTFFNTFEEIDFASLGSVNGIALRVVLIQNGEEMVLLEEDYAGYFANELSVPALYDFSDVRGAQIDLGITICDNCEASYADEQLTISNDSEAGEIQTCIPQDEFLRTQFGRNDQNLSSISLCVDVSDIVDPHLVFSIRQKDVEGQNSLNNSYLHLADVYAGMIALLEEPISTTNGETKNVEIPLPANYVGDLSLYVLTTETSTTLDNIGITSGAPSPTRRLTSGGFYFTYANPVTDLLELRANAPVPANTSVSLIAADGRLVARRVMQFRDADIDLSNQPAGLYFLSVSDGNSFRWAGKVVKL